MTHFQTPHGNPVEMTIRKHTSDWNTVNAILTEDEYKIPIGLTGYALDVGSHLGSWAIGIALDNPELRVIAIEALPENAVLVRQNIDANGLSDRVELIERSASCDAGTEEVGYGHDETHRFIGDQRGPIVDGFMLPTVTLSEIVERVGPIRLIKIDCEGCEFRFLDSPAIGQVEEIVGEYHGPIDALVDILATHTVIHHGDEGFGAFHAIRKPTPARLSPEKREARRKAAES